MLILSVSHDPELLESRSAILRAAGYAVLPATSTKHAIDYFQPGHFDLVLLDHSIPTQDKDRLIRLLRASDGHVLIVLVSAQPHTAPDPLADATIESTPLKLLNGIKDADANRAMISRATKSFAPPNSTEAAPTGI